MVEEIDVLRFIKILHLQVALDPRHPLLRECDGPALLLDRIIFILAQIRDHLVDPVVFVGGFLGWAGYDQRRPRFVDEDAVDLIHDGIVEVPLNIIIEVEFHVVAQIIETKFIVGPVGDVAVIGRAPLVVIHSVNDHADVHAEKLVDGTHPFGVSFRQIVINRHKMSSPSHQCVEV